MWNVFQLALFEILTECCLFISANLTMECCVFETHQRSKQDFMVEAHGYWLLTTGCWPPIFVPLTFIVSEEKVSLLYILSLSCRHCWDEKRSDLIKMLMCLLESPSVRSVSSAVSRVCGGGFVDFALGSASHATCSGCPIRLISESRWGCGAAVTTPGWRKVLPNVVFRVFNRKYAPIITIFYRIKCKI